MICHVMDIIQIDTDPHSIYMELDTIDGLHEFDGQLIQWHVMWLTVLKKEQFHIFMDWFQKDAVPHSIYLE